MTPVFYICKRCGKIIAMVKPTAVPTMCCGEPMTELVAGTTEAAREKHIPVYTVTGNTVQVTVGSVEHPMQEAHYIEWILLETRQGLQVKALTPGQAPKATFCLAEGDAVEAAYAYCNLHGLWKG